MKLFYDKPREYKENGKKWSHLFTPEYETLEAFAKENSLKRRDTSPFLHYDLTETELNKLIKKYSRANAKYELIEIEDRASIFLMMQDKHKRKNDNE